MADAGDLKSPRVKTRCGFDSRLAQYVTALSAQRASRRGQGCRSGRVHLDRLTGSTSAVHRGVHNALDTRLTIARDRRHRPHCWHNTKWPNHRRRTFSPGINDPRTTSPSPPAGGSDEPTEEGGSEGRVRGSTADEILGVGRSGVARARVLSV